MGAASSFGCVEGITVWAIYFNPSDYPGLFVLRRWLVTHGNCIPDMEPAAVEPTIEGVRAQVPDRCGRIPRHDRDDHVLVETWV